MSEINYKEKAKELQDKLDVMLVVVKNWRVRYENGEEDLKKAVKALEKAANKYRFDMDVMNKELKQATNIIENFKKWKKEESGYDNDTAMSSPNIVKKIEEIMNESLPNESLFVTVNNDYKVEKS